MLTSFLNFCLEVFSGMIEILQYTEIGGFTLEDLLVACLILLMIVRVVVVSYGG